MAKTSKPQARIWKALRLGLLSSVTLQSAQSETRPPARWFSEYFGACHAGGKYSIPTRGDTPVDYLNEGADRMVQLGTKCFKLWFNDNAPTVYANFTGLPELDWPATTGAGRTVTNMTQLAQVPFYQTVFARPELNTFVLEATEFSHANWKDGLNAGETQAVIDEFQSVTEYLRNTYQGTGRTFVLQNWEGDNLLNLSGFPSANWQNMTDGFTAYMKARQRGVTQGRAATPTSDANVWNALEINWNYGSGSSGINVPEEWTVLNKVVRDGYTNQGLVCDLYSWSCWSAKLQGQQYLVLRGLDYMRKRVPKAGPLAPDNIFFGEYGSYESLFYTSGSQVHGSGSDQTYASVQADLFANTWRGGARYAMQWNIYCNEVKSGVSFDPQNPVSLTQQDLKGFWLIRPPGPPTYPNVTYTAAWNNYADSMKLRLYADRLADFNHVHDRSSNWTIETTETSWDAGDQDRAFRTNNSTAEHLDYAVEGELTDWNIRAFLYKQGGNPSPTGRIRGYLSADGQTWEGPFDFGVVDSAAPDSSLTDWVRFDLKPPGSVSAGRRFLRIEVLGTQQNWATQIADVRLVARAPTPPSNPSATNSGAGATSLNWDAGTRPGVWTIQRALGTGGFTDVTTLEPGTTSFSETGLTPGVECQYRIGVSTGPQEYAWSPVTTVTPWSSLQNWRNDHFGTINNSGVAADTEDPDHDGLRNLWEYVLGNDPLVPDAKNNSPALSLAEDGSNRYLQIRIDRSVTSSDVTLKLEASTDLMNWVTGPGETTVVEDLPSLFIGRDAQPVFSNAHRFIRIGIDLAGD